MRANDFNYQYRRLWSAFKRPDDDLTPDRLAALFLEFGDLDLAVFTAAIDRAMCESKFPSFPALQAIAERAEDARRATIRGRRDSEAKEAMSSGVLPAWRDEWSGAEWEASKVLVRLCFYCWERDLDPQVAADMVEECLPEHPSLAPDVRTLRKMGKHWRNADGQYFCQYATPEVKQKWGVKPCDCEDCIKSVHVAKGAQGW